jgi:hypothetical protein
METIQDDKRLEQETVRKVTWRLLPFLMLCYLFAFIDRGNIGMAALQMNQDIGLSPKMFSFASSLFFIAYFILKYPATWHCRNSAHASAGTHHGHLGPDLGLYGLRAGADFAVVRFILGAAEAFFPGVVLYLTYWVPPSAYRARIVALFMVAIPAASFVASPVSALLPDGWHRRTARLALAVPAGRVADRVAGRVCLFFRRIAPIRRAGSMMRSASGWSPPWTEAASRTAKRHIPCGSCSASRMCGAWPWCAPARRPPVRC